MTSDAYNVRSFTDVDPEEWDAMVDGSQEGWLYQTSAWVEYAQRWGSKSVSFAVYDRNGLIVAVVPLYADHVRKGGLRIKRLLTGLSGPVIRQGLSPRTHRRVSDFIFRNIDDLAERLHADMLQVRLTTCAPAYLPPLRSAINPLLYQGIAPPVHVGLLGGANTLTRVIFLDKDEDVLFREMDEDCRNAVRQGERHGFQFVQGSASADVEIYVQLHRETWARTGLTPHPKEYFMDMWNTFAPDGRMVLLFAYDGTEVAATLLLHVYKGNVFYWGGASAEKSQRFRCNNYLMWNAIKWAKSSGFSVFEIGTFYPFPSVSAKEFAVGKYKAQFGRDTLACYEGQRIYSSKKFLLADIISSSAAAIGKIRP
jgi:lipid II:glycine glycyltransferase (peptidoglycan interpeptide bridge formation enzyme)